MDIFEMKAGDRKYALKYQLSDFEAGSALLSGASVRFKMMNSAGANVIDEAGVILDEDGIVAYEWASGDTDQAGRYKAEFLITFSDGLPQRYPSSGFIRVYINSKVPDA